MALRRVGLREDDGPRGLAGVRDERLRAVEDVLAAAALGRRLDARDVGARVRLAEAERAQDRLLGERRQPLRFCSSSPAITTGAEPSVFATIETAMPAQPHESSSPIEHPREAGQSRAAVLLREVDVHQADLVRLRDHVGRMRRVLVVLRGLRPDLLLGELARELAQRLLLVAEREGDAAGFLFDRRCRHLNRLD